MNLKNYNVWDIGLIKAAVFFGTLCLISLVPGFAAWVARTHWALFLVIGLALAIKPVIKTWK